MPAAYLRRFALAVGLIAFTVAGLTGSALAQVDGYSREAIRDFAVRIAVERDGSILVTEDIEVVALGYDIRRGIYRDIPLGGAALGLLGRARFDLVQALKNGQPEPHRIENDGANLRIYFGSPDVFLDQGVYRYRLVYRMSDQVRRFDDFDEIYWNVTGNEWSFPIENASAVVIPPPGAPVTQTAVYTGFYGQSGDDAVIGETAGGEPRFRTTRSLAPGEGMTVAVGWPPGYLDPITGSQRLTQWLERWGAYIAAAVSLGLVLLYYLIVWAKVGRDPRGGTVIPVYHPEIPPAAMRYIERMGFDDTCFAAAVINLAVKGHLTIAKDKKKQTLKALDPADGTPMSPGEAVLYDGLFAYGDQITIQRSSRSQLNAAASALKGHFDKTFNSIYFHRNRLWFALGVVITILGWATSAIFSARHVEALFLAIFPAIFTVVIGSAAFRAWKSMRQFGQSGEPGQIVSAVLQAFIVTVMAIGISGVFLGIGTEIGVIPFLTLIGVGLLNVVFFHLLKAPTAIGRAALDEIEGTRLYLTVAEEDRLKFANPPDKTPEHFHELLPYAIALDVETAWTEQFKAEIEAARTKDDGNPYLKPSWYSGSSRGGGFSDARQLRAVGSSLGAAYSAATVTRSSGGSGSSGGGSSGGGGGGGGGGGW
ncbi:DUF2207 domain-containing protein [Microbaculum sp. FT89]|uniref:DUF2207 domain-containing protein n=1 Tax=Microbaculum sp. FT89 TaxID=3447298 RepID=UPI003F535CDF